MKFTRRGLRARYPGDRISQIYLLPEHRVGYVSNPKAASSTVKLLLERLHAGNRDLEPGDVHAERRIPKLHLHGWEAVRRMLAGGLYGFTFVRDPVARAVSCYGDKVRSGRYRAKMNAGLGRRAPAAEVTFDDFLTLLETQPPEEMDPHWRPQHAVLMMDAIVYDRIGRVEDFKADLARIRAEAGLPDIPLARRNPAEGEVAVDLTPARRRRLEAVYRRDLELFGY